MSQYLLYNSSSNSSKIKLLVRIPPNLIPYDPICMDVSLLQLNEFLTSLSQYLHQKQTKKCDDSQHKSN